MLYMHSAHIRARIRNGFCQMSDGDGGGPGGAPSDGGRAGYLKKGGKPGLELRVGSWAGQLKAGSLAALAAGAGSKGRAIKEVKTIVFSTKNYTRDHFA